MPLLKDCGENNPSGQAIPGVPDVNAAVALAPNQGDHVFGDITGVLNNAFVLVFGGGQNMLTRMKNYNGTMHTLWQSFAATDFGHGAQPPLVNRQGAAETDRHAHMYGGYAARLQWRVCEIVCSGFVLQAESRRVGGYTKNWQREVLASFDDLFNHFVDETALHAYLAAPGAIRQANPVGVLHPPISVATATAWVAGRNGPGKNALQTVLTNLGKARIMLASVLERFESNTKKVNPMNDSWT